ncbi:XRE family transcriptional regulator [Aliifodinibius sp. S!AR15-10]|uniref:helix-turn-helix domain-containing protein n=1 Tax=Aliifodinibius sp. S!AR15-10 TaxID=2950437 RepID=UPI0028559A12|nr:XRE family transcriptional regulator [Aliifodinibius sp. S!AR15-10]MDR8390629.1 XRE family transcriptional regulator [Aliifodinibius sp. S!AR15-10]
MESYSVSDNGIDLEKDLEQKIGNRVKALRLLQKRTIQDLANGADLSKSMISKIENNKTIPSIAALVKIASSLGVSVSDILEAEEVLSAEFIPSSEVKKSITRTDKGYSIFPFASKYHHKKMQPFLITAKEGEVKEHKLTHDGEEFIYVINGVLNFKVGDTIYELKEGDSLYFSSLEPHGMMPASQEVVYIDIFV